MNYIYIYIYVIYVCIYTCIYIYRRIQCDFLKPAYLETVWRVMSFCNACQTARQTSMDGCHFSKARDGVALGCASVWGKGAQTFCRSGGVCILGSHSCGLGDSIGWLEDLHWGSGGPHHWIGFWPLSAKGFYFLGWERRVPTSVINSQYIHTLHYFTLHYITFQ